MIRPVGFVQRLLLLAMGRFLKDETRLFQAFAFLQKNNLKRLLNLLKSEWERRIGRTDVSCRPFILNIEVTNSCNFRCPFCFTGKRVAKRYGKLSVDQARRLADQFAEHAYYVTIHGIGEPLLNPEFDRIIDTFAERDVYTVMSSNVSLMDEAAARKILASKLDYLIVAIDGVTQRAYEGYRRGGKLDSVMANLRRLLELKKLSGKKTPFIEWQYIMFSHNAHEWRDARRLASRLGVDAFSKVQGYTEEPGGCSGTSRDKWERRSPLEHHRDCISLWSTATITWDGRFAACCWDDYADSKFGNIFESDFGNVWNNKKFQASRSLVVNGPEKVTSGTICDICIRNIGDTAPTKVRLDLAGGPRAARKGIDGKVLGPAVEPAATPCHATQG